MLVRKKKDNRLKIRGMPQETASDETLQSVRSWIRKIEQTTTSVSMRLSAVEKRLSGGTTELNNGNCIGREGPIETLFLNIKKRNAGELARLLDGELTVLHNEVFTQQLDANNLKEQLEIIERINTTITNKLQAMQTTISEMSMTMEKQMKHIEHREPFIMHVGRVEIPIEFTGIIGGLLAFIVTILVLINQKEILLSPVFLVSVGLLFLGFSLVKMIRFRNQSLVHPSFSMPLNVPSAQIDPIPIERKEG